MCVCLCVCVWGGEAIVHSLNHSFNHSINQSINQQINQSIRASNLWKLQSVHLCVRLTIHQPTYLLTYLPTCLPVCLVYVYLSLYHLYKISRIMSHEGNSTRTSHRFACCNMAPTLPFFWDIDNSSVKRLLGLDYERVYEEQSIVLSQSE